MDQVLERQVRDRARGLCEYFRMPEAYDRPAFEIEHIIAKQHGGKTVASNLAAACFTCNHRKGPHIAGRDPKTGKLTRLLHPRRHKWERHFAWDGPLLVGRTPVGRTTIIVPLRTGDGPPCLRTQTFPIQVFTTLAVLPLRSLPKCFLSHYTY